MTYDGLQTVAPTVAPGCADGGHTVASLAAERGCSRDTIRRAIKSGTLAAHRVTSRHGPSWCVHPDGDLRPSHDGVHTVVPTVAQGSADGKEISNAVTVFAEAEHLAALVSELTAQVAELSAAATLWQERARVLSEQLALMAPQSPVEARQAPPPVDVALGPSTWLSWPHVRTVVVITTVAVLASFILLLVPR